MFEQYKFEKPFKLQEICVFRNASHNNQGLFSAEQVDQRMRCPMPNRSLGQLSSNQTSQVM